ncbi:MAG: hypothetical protein U5K76_07210 [Woeseiaceae bacterium]|nr:hypothetical protein [Woeseiaceae bacterium]
MKIRLSLLFFALAISLPGWAQLTTVVRAVEMSTANINVPTTPNGRLMFKPCSDTCDAAYQSARLTPDTSYEVNGERLDFIGFRNAFNNLQRGEDHYALVSYDAESNTVTSVQIAG